MDKYSGCNKVESVSYAPQKPATRKAKRKDGYLPARLVTACALVACICAAAFIPALAPVRKAVKRVMCYDVFGREAGSTPIISRLF